MEITLAELEQAINYWRTLRPSQGEECALSPEVNALANVYAEMIFSRGKTVPAQQCEARVLELMELWRKQRI